MRHQIVVHSDEPTRRMEGFTLVEVLVAIAIVSIGVLALTQMQVQAIKGTSFNKQATAATAMADRVIESYKSAAFGATPALCGTTQGGLTVACDPDIQGTSPNRYNDITVTITWDTPQKSISLSTTIAER